MRANEFLNENDNVTPIGKKGDVDLHKVPLDDAYQVLRKVGFNLNHIFNMPYDMGIYTTLIDAYMNKMRGTKDDYIMRAIIKVYERRGIKAGELPPKEELTENPLAMFALRGLGPVLARMGVKKFAMWLLKFMFTTTAGLTLTAILALVQLIITATINMAVTGTTMGIKAVYNAFKDQVGEDEADRLIKELDAELEKQEQDDDLSSVSHMNALDNQELHSLAQQLNEADVEYGSTKPGKRMHKIGHVYGKKKLKLPTAKYKDNRTNKQKGIFKK